MHNGSINWLRRAADAAGIGWWVRIDAPPPDYALAVEPEFMKFRRLIVASLTSLIASVPTGTLLEACEQCRGNNACHTCTTADDNGLLDLLDAASHRLQPRLPRVSMPRVPSLDTALKFALGGRPAASCGCEIIQAGCGCELHEPSCGCEAPTGCSCHHQTEGGSVRHYEVHSFSEPQHVSESLGIATRHTAPESEALPTPRVAPQTAPRGSAQSGVPHINSYPPAASPQPPARMPAPSRVPVPSPVPVPDSQIDPFRDDTATRVRQIPARPIQYRQVTPTYRQNYDPQASNGSGAHMRLSDDHAPAVDRIALDDQSSSRSRRVQEPAARSQAHAPNVVTASGSSLHSYDQRQSQPTPLGPTNPLRSN